MKRRIAIVGALALAAGTLAFGLTGAPASAVGGGTRQIPSGGTTAIRATADGTGAISSPEFAADVEDGKAEPTVKAVSSTIFPRVPLPTPTVRGSALAPTNPQVIASVDGLNHRNQRLANGGNQFSVEPPDQALCVGNGFVVESVNSVLRVYDSATGAALTGVQDLNTFFGYPAAINRATGAFGPDVIDPVCTYDPDNGRFVVAITTLFHVGTTSAFNGKNSIDVAVSNSNDPTGTWTIYHAPAQNDGTDGTPDHHCTLDGVTPGPCFQDYPHIGGDKNGIYITTNEYDLFGPSYNAAQIFAFSKAQLAAHPASVSMTLVENLHLAGTPGFTVWPATSPAGQYESGAQGTEYFLSTIAGDGSETGNPTGTANRIGLWALSNTSSLNSATPALGISSRAITARTYVFPPKANQKPGDTPLGECLNDNTLFGGGVGCWALFFNSQPAQPEVESHLDASDTRMQQTWFTNHMLWGTAGTAVKVGGATKAGIVWFGVEPSVNSSGAVSGEVSESGYVALAGNNLTYPAIAMNTKGKGVIAFTATGDSLYPSAGYVTINRDGEVGPVHIAAAGQGPADGFTSYKAFVGDPPRTRWGDYGAAVTEGDSIWMASEYIGQTCTLTEYLTGAIGSCGGTRTSLGNWGTRLTKVTP